MGHQECIFYQVPSIVPHHQHHHLPVLLLAHLVRDLLLHHAKGDTVKAGGPRTGAETDGDRLEVRVTGVVLRNKLKMT